MIELSHELDVRGLKCPLPVLKARRALREIDVDDVLTILVTDPQAPDDFVHFCTTTGNEFVGSRAKVDHILITVRRLV